MQFAAEGIDWEVVEDLASTALQWRKACKSANKFFQQQCPFSLEDLDMAMGQPASETARAGAGKHGIAFGHMHVLRARLNEVWRFSCVSH